MRFLNKVIAIDMSKAMEQDAYKAGKDLALALKSANQSISQSAIDSAVMKSWKKYSKGLPKHFPAAYAGDHFLKGFNENLGEIPTKKSLGDKIKNFFSRNKEMPS
jgi:hypothetical protein